jgi:hypothetical protein
VNGKHPAEFRTLRAWSGFIYGGTLEGDKRATVRELLPSPRTVTDRVVRRHTGAERRTQRLTEPPPAMAAFFSRRSWPGVPTHRRCAAQGVTVCEGRLRRNFPGQGFHRFVAIATLR